MSTHYRLYPPFLYVAEQQDFSKAWEYFCCKLLNISNKTREIYVRNPPEQGIDIYYKSKKIAYQCKSVESGKPGDFNVTHAVNSIKAAKKVKAKVGWEKYVLCVNVAITGNQEAILKKELPDIEILPESHWQKLCGEFPIEVEKNFRKLLEVPRDKMLAAIHDRFVPNYSAQLTGKISSEPFDIFLYTNRYDTTYRVPVSGEFTCEDLLGIFRAFFKLPESKAIESEGIKVSLSHAVVFNGKKQKLSNTLSASGISHGDVVTYWTGISWKDAEEKFDGDVMHFMTGDVIGRATKSKVERKEEALSEFKQILKNCFEAFDNELSVR